MRQIQDADVDKARDIVKRVAATHVRHPHWREDAEQEAWLGIIRAASRSALSDHLVAHITVNATRYVLRGHKNDGLSMSDPTVLDTRIPKDDPGLAIDLGDFIAVQLDTRRRVLQHVLEGGNYTTFRDLARQTQTSLATVSRAMKDLEQWLLNRLREE